MKIALMVFVVAIFSLTIFIEPQYTQQDKIGINEIGLDELSEIIKNRKEKVLLLNIWATWCVPCIEEFPGLKKLSNQYQDKIDVIGISIDYPDEIDSKIYPFLNKVQPGFINYVNEEKNAEKFINFLNGEWSGAIPATFIYDTNGNQSKFLIGKQSFEEFEEVVLNNIN